jgi:glycosyltransferase involved in cell wall biosynthesis
MRIGIDLRGVVYDSATRGIGSYISSLMEGVVGYGDPHEYVLFHRQGFPLPPRLAALPATWERIEVAGTSWQDPRPSALVMRIPKLRGLPFVRDPYYDRMVASNRILWEEAVKAANLDLLFLPSAVDLGSFPTGDFPCPRVSVFLDAIPLRRRASFYDTWFPSIRRMFDAQLSDLRRSEAVVAISDASGRDAVELVGVPADRVTTVYCAVADLYFGRAPDQTRTESPYFLFCSALDDHKNWRGLLEAFALISEDVRLVMVAKESPSLRQELGRLGLGADRVLVTGWVEEEELHRLLAGAVALVSPSFIEGFGLPAAQALACGTPVVVSQDTALAEVAADAGALVDPNSPEDIARGMRLMLDPAQRAVFAANARPAAERFRSETVTRKLMQVFANVHS